MWQLQKNSILYKKKKQKTLKIKKKKMWNASELYLANKTEASCPIKYINID